MTLRLFVELPLAAGAEVDLPPGPARHVHVRRLQPGEPLVVFDGRGGEWRARVRRIGRREVVVGIESHDEVDREAVARVTLAVGMPAGERMDWLVEKATELGAAAIQPLTTARSVLRLDDDRAGRKRAHWQAIAVAAAEQCGRTRVPLVEGPMALARWLDEAGAARRGWVLTLPQGSGAGACGPAMPDDDACDRDDPKAPVVVLSGPEGGLTDDEQQQALRQGLRPWSLGPRVLRAETAPLAALARLTA
jgi:16S rRNA (uracil1498-N3)-methyltransferase